MIALGAAAIAAAAAIGVACMLVYRADAVARRNVVESDVEYLRRALAEREKADGGRDAGAVTGKAERRLRSAGIGAAPSCWRLLQAAVAFAAAGTVAAATGSAPLAVASAAAVPAAAAVYVSAKAKRRRILFSEQLASALPLVAENIRTGMTVKAAVRSVTECMDDPLRGEFVRVNSAVAFGTPIEDALADMAKRSGGPDAMQLAMAVAISESTGGKLAETIDRVARNIDEKIGMRRHVKALTSDQNASKCAMAVMPWILLALWMQVSPDVAEFYRTTAGFAVIVGVIGAEAIGLLAIAKITDLRLEREDPWNTR